MFLCPAPLVLRLAPVALVLLGACRHEPPKEEFRSPPQAVEPAILKPTTTGALPNEAPYAPRTADELRDSLAKKRASSTYEEYLGFLSQTARTLILDDPAVVTAFLAELPLGTDAQGPANVYVHRLSKACTPDIFAAALQGIASLKHYNARCHEILIQGYARTSPLEALRSLTQHREIIGNDKPFQRATETALANAIATGKVPVEDLLAAIPEDLPRGSIIATGEVGTELGKEMNTERFLELLSKAPPLTAQEQSHAASAYGYGLLHARWPEEKRTTTLLQTLQSAHIPENLRVSIGDGYIATMISRDLNNALALAAQFPSGRIRDRIVSKNIRTIAAHDKEAAHAWALIIEDTSLREQTLQDLEP